ncbi:hypothetical protein D3C81_1425030 [compost metagenome]
MRSAISSAAALRVPRARATSVSVCPCRWRSRSGTYTSACRARSSITSSGFSSATPVPSMTSWRISTVEVDSATGDTSMALRVKAASSSARIDSDGAGRISG